MEISPSNHFILEENQRLSQSLLWKLQRNFFKQQGIEAWREGIVPHYVTSNPYLAKAYVKVILGFLRDCCSFNTIKETTGIDIEEPIYIVELGVGSGRFSYHFLKQFWDLVNRSIFRGLAIKYVMTDFSQSNIDFWQSHPYFKHFIAEGKLDFARFDAEVDTEIQLIYSQATLSAETLKNPLVVIANYFFDSIPQDLFYLEKEQIYETLVSLVSSQGEVDTNEVNLIEKLEIEYKNKQTSFPYYEDEKANHILKCYQNKLDKSYLLLPTAGFKVIQNLAKLSQDKFLFISGDKGYSREQDLYLENPPSMTKHGSFSWMVNYHAMNQYIQQLGGQSLITQHRHYSINICAFLLGDNPQDYLETKQAYYENIEQSNPDSFFTVKKALDKHYDSFDLRQILAYLRLSGWDSNIFFRCFPSLIEQLNSASVALFPDVYQAVQNVFIMYYPLGDKQDVFNCLGMILFKIGYYQEALEYFDYSLNIYGNKSNVLFNVALCHYLLKDYSQALDYLDLILQQDSKFEEARLLRIKLKAEIST